MTAKRPPRDYRAAGYDPKVARAATLEIERGVPIPSLPERSGYVVDAMRELAKAQIGDSMFIPGKHPHALRQAALKVGSKWHVARHETRDGVKGARIWKIAEPGPRTYKLKKDKP